MRKIETKSQSNTIWWIPGFILYAIETEDHLNSAYPDCSYYTFTLSLTTPTGGAIKDFITSYTTATERDEQLQRILEEVGLAQRQIIPAGLAV